MIDEQYFHKIICDLRNQINKLEKRVSEFENKNAEIVFPTFPNTNKATRPEINKAHAHWQKAFEDTLKHEHAPVLKLNEKIKRIFDLAIKYYKENDSGELNLLRQSANEIVDLSIRHYTITEIDKCTIGNGQEMTDIYRDYFDTVKALNNLGSR